MMAGVSKRLIVVFGATGGQGGSVARAFQANPDFRIRAITRNRESEKAKALAQAGAEVVSANQDDGDSLVTALQGAYGVFAVTNYWEHMDSEREIKQGKNIADACKANGVQHVVWSGLENVKEHTGKECPLFDDKAIVEDYMKELGLAVTSVRYSAFMENFFGANKPTKVAENTYVLGIPVKSMDSVPSMECGPCIRSIFQQGDVYKGKMVGFSSFQAPVEEYARILTKHLEGKQFTPGDMTIDKFRTLGFPGCDYFANMYEALEQGVMVRDVNTTKALNPEISDFDTWVQKNKDKLLAVLD